VRQVRAAVQAELEEDGCDGFDFNGEAFKKQIKDCISVAVARRQQEHQREDEGAGSSSDDGSSSSVDDDDNDDDDDDDDSGSSSGGDESPTTQKRKKGGKKVNTKGTKKGKTAEQPPPAVEDPVFKSLKDLAVAMGVVPGVYRGFPEMTQDEKIKVLRKRLKEKGAKFYNVPTAADIAAAKAKRDREKDLEGIDLSNVIEDGKRRRGGASSIHSSSSVSQKKVVDDSSSEEEVDF